MRLALALLTVFVTAPAEAAPLGEEWQPKPRPRVIQVVDDRTGKAIAGVEVSGCDAEQEVLLGSTSAKGKAEVPPLLPRWKFLKVRQPGYATLLVDTHDVETYFAGTYHTYSRHYDGFAGVLRLDPTEEGSAP